MFFNKQKRLLAQTDELLQETSNSLEQTRIELAKTQEELNKGTAENRSLNEKYSVFIERDTAVNEQLNQIAKTTEDLQQLNEKYQSGLTVYSKLEKEINLFEDTLELGSFGLYEPQFDFQNPEEYKIALLQNYDKQKTLVKGGLAAICSTEWMVGGSKAEGRKMSNQYIKLMLFAFDGECEGCIAKVKWNTATKTKERIEKTFENINKLGVTQNVYVTDQFLQLKIEQLCLTHEYELKQHAINEEQRRIREQMREEEKAQRDFERAKHEAEEEEIRFKKALDKAKQELGSATHEEVSSLNDQIKSLEQKLQSAQERKERAISLAQQTKVGHIYVVSNIGSFGDGVYKIGLTRRLDPLDRVRELGDASVPFHFDVHAVIYSDNAPQFEFQLHQRLNDKRINRMNNRKEFFKVSLEEIEDIVRQSASAEIQFTKLAEAREYRESIAMLERLNQAAAKTNQEAEYPASLI